jgi:hypothetical protein
MNGRKTTEAVLDVRPTLDAGVMARVNRYALTPQTAEQVCVIQGEASNAVIDRDGELQSLECLEDYAASAGGKSLMVSHSWDGLGVGRLTDGWLEGEGPDTRLMIEAYLLRKDAEANALIRKIEGGVATYLSIGFFAPVLSKEVVDGREVGVYRRGADGSRAELIECSVVFLGSAIGAAITAVKAVGRRGACGRAPGSCALERAVIETELGAVKHRLLEARCPTRPLGQPVSLVELHQKVRRLEDELELVCHE